MGDHQLIPFSAFTYQGREKTGRGMNISAKNEMEKDESELSEA